MKINKIYFARPFSGFNKSDVEEYYKNIAAYVEKNKLDIEILCPLLGKEVPEGCVMQKSGYNEATCRDHAIFRRDSWMVSQSDIVICDFSEANDVSIGCCMEIAIASWLHKHVIVVLNEGNIHCHAFVNDAADIILPDMKSALEYITCILK